MDIFREDPAVLPRPAAAPSARRGCTISVNMMTAGPAARSAAVLALLRPVVDELLVAVDDRAGADVLDAVTAVADRVVTYPYAEPVDRPLAWLHAECAGDWVLTIDDDEIPSAALLDALPGLTAAEDLTHYLLPRRWLYPDAGRCLDQDPWRHDWLIRLVRNDSRLLVFPFELHEPIRAIGPCRYPELPIYHVDAIVNSRAAREQKARRYDAMRPGTIGVGGGTFNESFYLPERRRRLRLAALPDPDRRLVEAVLSAPDPPAPNGRPSAPVSAVGREEIDAHWSGRPFGPASYHALIEPLADPRPMVAGETRQVAVRLTNLGDRAWPWGDLGRPEVRLSYHWWDADGQPVAFDGLRTPLPGPLAPGESSVVLAAVSAPSSPGAHRLELDLVHEGERWFGRGAEMWFAVIGRRRRGRR